MSILASVLARYNLPYIMRFSIKCFLLIIVSFLFLIPSCLFAHASAKNTISLPVVTVINPIRGSELGLEKANLLTSLQVQWQVTKDAEVNATWLWQYTALKNKQLTDFAKSQMHQQEFGLFLEVDRDFAKKAHVQYRGRGPWYFSDGLLLMSYDQTERKKLIDTAFEKFKKTFGYYPKTVGAWWIEANSLVYMQKKYGIIASLRAADQFDLDVYSIWGTPWSIPYIPSQDNAGIPAGSWDKSSKVVIMQWAARDPTQAYGDSLAYSTYSMQDFGTKNYGISYFDYLAFTYLRKPLDQIVVGLEGGRDPSVYQGAYQQELMHVHEWEKNQKIHVALAKDYADTFLAQRTMLAPTHYLLTKDFQSDDQSFWYHSVNFRAGVQKRGDTISLVDVRDYAHDGPEDFSLLPNSQGYLRITEPAIIDSVRFPNEKRFIAKSNDALRIKENNDAVVLVSGEKKIAFFTPTRLQVYSLEKEEFAFNPTKFSIDIFRILLVIFLFYFFVILGHERNIRKTLIQSFPLLFPLVIAYPLLSAGHLDKLTFLFDRKEFVLTDLLAIPYFSPNFRMLLIFQIIPFLLLLVSHYIFMIRLSGRKYSAIYFGFLSVILLLYAHLPYFPLDRSTYAIVFGTVSLFVFIAFAGNMYIFYKTKSRKIFFSSLIGIVVGLGILGGLLLFSRQRFILTPFEMDALQIVISQHKNVLYLFPTDKPIYKAVRPVLYDNYQFAEKLTGTHWQKITRTGKNILQLQNYDNRLIVVPRYFGSDISMDEINKFNLVKIFDNAQIAIFRKR